ncbi:UNVERIFIED_CONTAM: hypothetical protein Sradi_4525500 [Sesamum radiatum]|uniref:Reverse transcriptase zinc-binding domain-containing protein n=1 Tax=Sesamum radiatum TaxID=300843 RepID=A0AAW2N998_SESRA
MLATTLRISVIVKRNKYLGLHAVGGRSKGEMVAGIRKKVVKGIQGWNAKFLSSAISPVQGRVSAWSFLWSRKIPNKVKVFGWRLFHDALPIVSNLEQRRMDVEDLSPSCKLPGESLVRCFISCSFIHQVWAISLLPYWTIFNFEGSLEGWLQDVCSTLPADAID